MQRSWLTLLLLMIGANLPRPGTARAEEITLNVPVRLSNLPAEVTRGLIECQVRTMWGAAEAPQRFETTDPSASTTFAIDPNAGSFSQTVAVRVKNDPPKRWVDLEYHVSALSRSYVCGLSLATQSSEWWKVYVLYREGGGTQVRFLAAAELPPWAKPNLSLPFRPGVSGEIPRR